jgi:hypothetical protein
MRKFTRKQKIAAAGTVAVVALGGGAAYAYWSSTGTGQGGAATAADQKPVDISTAGASITDLTPGGPAKALNLTLKNGANGTASLRTVTVKLDSVSKDGTTITDPNVCSPADFTVTQPVPAKDAAGNALPWVVPAKSTLAATGATIAMNDDPARNQDGCKAVGLNLSYSAGS